LLVSLECFKGALEFFNLLKERNRFLTDHFFECDQRINPLPSQLIDFPELDINRFNDGCNPIIAIRCLNRVLWLLVGLNHNLN
jgi:hypothetical protein